jgi:hypothetical protein
MQAAIAYEKGLAEYDDGTYRYSRGKTQQGIRDDLAPDIDAVAIGGFSIHDNPRFSGVPVFPDYKSSVTRFPDIP